MTREEAILVLIRTNDDIGELGGPPTKEELDEAWKVIGPCRHCVALRYQQELDEENNITL